MGFGVGDRAFVRIRISPGLDADIGIVHLGIVEFIQAILRILEIEGAVFHLDLAVLEVGVFNRVMLGVHGLYIGHFHTAPAHIQVDIVRRNVAHIGLRAHLVDHDLIKAVWPGKIVVRIVDENGKKTAVIAAVLLDVVQVDVGEGVSMGIFIPRNVVCNRRPIPVSAGRIVPAVDVAAHQQQTAAGGMVNFAVGHRIVGGIGDLNAKGLMHHLPHVMNNRILHGVVVGIAHRLRIPVDAWVAALDHDAAVAAILHQTVVDQGICHAEIQLDAVHAGIPHLAVGQGNLIGIFQGYGPHLELRAFTGTAVNRIGGIERPLRKSVLAGRTAGIGKPGVPAAVIIRKARIGKHQSIKGDVLHRSDLRIVPHAGALSLDADDLIGSGDNDVLPAQVLLPFPGVIVEVTGLGIVIKLAGRVQKGETALQVIPRVRSHCIQRREIPHIVGIEGKLPAVSIHIGNRKRVRIPRSFSADVVADELRAQITALLCVDKLIHKQVGCIFRLVSHHRVIAARCIEGIVKQRCRHGRKSVGIQGSGQHGPFAVDGNGIDRKFPVRIQRQRTGGRRPVSFPEDLVHLGFQIRFINLPDQSLLHIRVGHRRIGAGLHRFPIRTYSESAHKPCICGVSQAFIYNLITVGSGVGSVKVDRLGYIIGAWQNKDINIAGHILVDLCDGAARPFQGRKRLFICTGIGIVSRRRHKKFRLNPTEFGLVFRSFRQGEKSA